ncbi:MAG: PP2C family protein-serine/threonine phosphatase [Alphaproteobacteria bacterium]
MLLRTRLAIIVGIAITLLALGLGAAAVAHSRLGSERHTEAVLSGDRALWRATVANTVAELDAIVRPVAHGADLARTVRSDAPAAAARLGPTFDAARAARRLSRLEMIGADGLLLYTSQRSLFPTPILGREQVRAVMAENGRFAGLAADASHNLVIAVAEPVDDAEGVVAALVPARDASEVLAAFAADTGAQAFIVNRRGRMLAGTDHDLWKRLGDGGTSSVDTREIVHDGERVLALYRLALNREGGHLAVDLIVVRDITEEDRAFQHIMLVSTGGAGSAIVLTILTLVWYMRASFAPMTAAIGVLGALSRGDTHRTIDGVRPDDEIGHMAGAVEALRREMIALGRLRRSQDRHRLRQEHFIHTQMVRLAGTLDDDSRAEVLNDLTEIEAVAAGPTGSGLGIIAPAMQKMSARVAEQHARLRQAIDDLREALAVKTAFASLQRELGIASSMQIAILPKALPGRETFEIYGTMTPAKDVGGDFYDFFMIDETRLGVVVADVSGKGVPAAFFMAIARTLLKATALFGGPPGECLAKLNDLLAENNDQEMFVTIFYGIYHEDSGRLDYANGGHNPPLWLHGGEVSRLEGTGGMALAMIDGLSYAETSVTLAPGDSLFLYTDGVTEAFDPDDVAFGEERLTETLTRLADAPAREIPAAVTAEVDAFVRGAAPSDDITCVALRRTRRSLPGGGGIG